MTVSIQSCKWIIKHIVCKIWVNNLTYHNDCWFRSLFAHKILRIWGVGSSKNINKKSFFFINSLILSFESRWTDRSSCIASRWSPTLPLPSHRSPKCSATLPPRFPATVAATCRSRLTIFLSRAIPMLLHLSIHILKVSIEVAWRIEWQKSNCHHNQYELLYRVAEYY